MPEPKAKKSKHVFLFLRIAVVVCGIACGAYWVSRGQRWSTLVGIFLRMNLWIFAGVLGIFVIGQVIVGLRWWLLLRTQSIFINFWAAVRLHFLGLFYNNFMPSSVGGDLIRAWYATKHTNKKFEAALSVFVDRAIGLLSTLIIASFFYTLFLRGRGSVITRSDEEQGAFLKSVAEYKGLLLWVAGAIVVVFCGFLLHKRGRAVLEKVWSSICVHGARMIKKLRSAIVLYCSKPLTILTVFGLTFFLQILTITSFWFLGVNLGIEASIKYYYVFFTLTWVLGAGGAVVVEGLLAYLFVQIAGVKAETALALALCQRIVWMLASSSGAVIHLMGAHLPKDFFIDYDNSTN